jgi:hypothetical protein
VIRGPHSSSRPTAYIRRVQGSGSYVQNSDKPADFRPLKVVSLIMSLHWPGPRAAADQGIEQKLKASGFILTVP